MRQVIADLVVAVLLLIASFMIATGVVALITGTA